MSSSDHYLLIIIKISIAGRPYNERLGYANTIPNVSFICGSDPAPIFFVGASTPERVGASFLMKYGDVGLSNMLDSEGEKEFARREPVKGTHGKIIGTAVVQCQLVFKVL